MSYGWQATREGCRAGAPQDIACPIPVRVAHGDERPGIPEAARGDVFQPQRLARMAFAGIVAQHHVGVKLRLAIGQLPLVVGQAGPRAGALARVAGLVGLS